MKIPTLKFVFDRKKTADSYRDPNRKKTGLVQLEVYYERSRKWMSTGLKLYDGQWSDTKGVINHPDSGSKNEQLRLIMKNANSIVVKLMESKEGFSFERFEKLMSPEESSVLVLDVLDDMIERFKATHKEGSHTTLSILRNRLEEWGVIKTFSDLTYFNIEAFDTMLKQDGLKDSTIATYHQKLKAVCVRVQRMGKLEYMPYDDFEITTEKNYTVKYLVESELKKVYDYKARNSEEEFVKDFFTFQSMTGMSFIDVYTLRVSDLEKVGDKYFVRLKRRIKTGVEFSVVVLPDAKKILDKYGGSLNILTYHQMRPILHEIGLLTIKRKITSHMARHSFATIALRHGIPIEYVAKMLGHTKIATTQKYAKVINEDVIKQFEKLDGVFNNK